MTGTPEVLMDMRAFDSRVMFGFPKVLAGHCRAKTVGDNTRSNAHPYDFETVIGMHNGTLRNQYRTPFHDHTKTDSHCLYANIDESGLETAMTNVDPAGAWALVFWDKTDNTLNFLRNKERPLWFAWTKDKRAMVWASEPGMFWAMARREELWNGQQADGSRVSPYIELPENTLWKFTINDRATKDEKVMHLHQVKEVVATGNFTTPYHYQRNTQTGGGAHNSNVTRTPFEWERQQQLKAQQLAQTGGKVANPFTANQLVDKVDDIGLPKVLLPSPPATFNNPDASQITTFGTDSTKTPSSNVLDMRPESMLTKKPSRGILSLASTNSKSSQQEANASASSKSSGSTPSCAASSPLPLPKQVSLRTISGINYIADKATSKEYSETGFDVITGSVCSFCRHPIGDLSEVHTMFNAGMDGFICTGCVNEDLEYAEYAA